MRIPPLPLLAALVAVAVPAPATAASLTHNEVQPGGGAVRVPRATRAARTDFRDQGRQTLLDVDERTGGVRVMGRLGALLTPEDDRSGRAVALDYVRDHRDVLGLDRDDIAALRPSRRAAGGGLEQVDWLQTYKGLSDIDSSLRVNLTAAGRIVNVQSTLWHDLELPSVEPGISARAAYARAARSLGGRAGPGHGRAQLVIYNAATGPRLGWRMLVRADAEHVFDVVSDAQSGDVQRASNYVRNATATIDRNYPGAATGGADEVVNVDAYLNGGATTLNGPYAHTVADPGDAILGPGDENLGTEINASGGNFNFALTPLSFPACSLSPCVWRPGTASSWLTNRPRDAAQLHWFVSNYHDYLAAAPISFTAANGNLEGADNVIAQSMDGSTTAGGGLPDSGHVNNANMATYPDGTHAFMQMYLTNALGGQSTGLDASVVYHEYTHGLIGRSIVDGSGVAAADGFQGGALNEATADWFALDYLNSATSGGLETDAAGDGDVLMGAYTFGGIRSEPTDCAVGSAAPACDGAGTAGTGGYTYGDFGRVNTTPEVHADGEILTQALWQLRQALIAKHGAVTGENHVRRMVAQGLRLTPPHPSFLDLRNAILQADTAAGLGDAAEIWDAFAARGMGYFASTEENDIHPVEDFSDVPAAGSPTGTVSGTVTDANTGAPLAGVKVAFSGHDTGVGPALTATTSASGGYSIAGVPAGTYPELRANGQPLGYDSERAAAFAVAPGVNGRDFAL
ncbi:MAG: extracellular elastinolytic metalloproteinase, partial [Miltoncostaeaceae bacterium]|nr:extracellular elastinolytic metalloproteinase [Miltoncostaeaceae bacterium]